MGSFYPWADPDYIANKMTETQLFGYSQNISVIKNRDADGYAAKLVLRVGETFFRK